MKFSYSIDELTLLVRDDLLDSSKIKNINYTVVITPILDWDGSELASVTFDFKENKDESTTSV